MKNWDNIARRYVEHDVSAMETFGEMGMYGKYTPIEVRNNLPVAQQPAGRPMTGFFASLSPAQQKAALAYSGPENHGDSAFVRGRGPYISTLNGRFYLDDPRPEDVDIEHIAHSLAMSCRYTGSVKRFYSTAEHSVHLARWLLPAYGREVALCALLHDAPEALSGFGDVGSPRKRKMPLVGQVEQDIWCEAVAPAFGLPDEIPNVVHDADSRICHDEMTQNMHEVDPNVGPPLGIDLEYWSPEVAKSVFLDIFHQLTGEDSEQMDPFEFAADMAASRADFENKARREAE